MAQALSPSHNQATAMAMSIAVPTLSSPNSSVLAFKKSASFSPFLATRFRRRAVPLLSHLTGLRPVLNSPVGFNRIIIGILYGRNSPRIFAAENGGVVDEEGDEEYRGESTLPDRFRYLTKEAPDPPLRWPWFIAAGFLLYAWRAVLFELSNWKKAALAIFGFGGYLLKLVLALIFVFIGDPITSLIRGLETGFYTIRAFYSGIVAYTPVSAFTTMIILSLAVLAIAEATEPDSVSSQPYVLTVAGLVAFAAVGNFISDLFFWTALVGLYGFSRLIKKRDNLLSTLPVAMVLAAIGESWVRVLTIVSYLAVAISHHSKKSPEGKKEAVVAPRRLPLPLFAVALAVGIRLAANWAGYRHLTWMIV